MKELIKPIQIKNNCSSLYRYCEIDCNGCQEAMCNKNCKSGSQGNSGIENEEDILF
jgi:hypothetical protein